MFKPKNKKTPSMTLRIFEDHVLNIILKRKWTAGVIKDKRFLTGQRKSKYSLMHNFKNIKSDIRHQAALTAGELSTDMDRGDLEELMKEHYSRKAETVIEEIQDDLLFYLGYLYSTQEEFVEILTQAERNGDTEVSG